MAGTGRIEAMDVSALIKEHLTCSLCLDTYNDPRTIPCQHAFCCKCLQSHIDLNVEEGRRSFKCPLCRKSTRPPNPRRIKHTWANQFKPDFKLTGLRDQLQAYVPKTTSESEAVDHAGAPTAAAASAAAPVASSTTMPTPKMPRPIVQPIPELRQESRHAPTRTIQNNGRTSNYTRQPHLDSTERTEQAQRCNIPSRPILHTADANSLEEASGNNSNRATYGSVERCIVLASGDQVSYDLTVLVQGDKRIILTPHYEEKKLLAITLNPKMEEVSRCSLNLDATPSRICNIDNNTLAITTSNPNTIALYTMQDELLCQKRIPTKKSYDGIARLEDRRFVVTTGIDVDVIDCDGLVREEYKITVQNVLRPDNCYVSVTPDREMVTSDLSGHTLSCIKRNGKLFWQKKKRKSYKSPMGTAVDSSGAIFLAENELETIVQLDKMGSVVCNVVEKSPQFRKPSAIALDNTGYMFVICDYNFVAVVKLSNHNS